MSDSCSENSISKFDGGGDIHAKYSRLAAEYSKMRAQNSVLKKAVIDEQAKNAELTDAVKDREQIIRKTNQEMESLNFRNMQLSRRVVVLQEELDNLQNNKKVLKKTKTKNSDVPNGSVSDHTLDDELKRIIMENAQIISNMHEKETRYEKEIISLKDEVEKLNREIEQCNNELKQANIEHKMIVSDLKAENKELKQDNAQKIVKLKNMESDLVTLNKAYASYVNETAPKLRLLQGIIAHYPTFLDSTDSDLNRLNIRPSSLVDKTTIDVSSSIKENLSEVIKTICNIIKCIGIESKVPNLTNLYTGIEKSDRNGSVKILKELKRCIDHLNDASASFKEDLELSMCKFLRTFLEIGLSFSVTYIRKMKNVKFQDDEFSNVNTLPLANQISLLQMTKTELSEKCAECRSVNQITLQEYFVRLDNSINKLLAEVVEKDSRLQQLADDRENVLIRDFKRKCARYMCCVREDDIERVPYAKAIKNQRELKECMILQSSLKEELSQLKDAITKAEQDKQYWMNEYNLLCIKNNSTPQNMEPICQSQTNDLGTLLAPFEINKEVMAREEEVKNYFTGRLNAVTAEKQEAYSKARTFMFESKFLQRRLEACIAEKQLMERQLSESRRTVLDTQEELSTVSQNYEQQLSMMSEHLANVNDKLTIQSDKIDELNYQLNCKGANRK